LRLKFRETVPPHLRENFEMKSAQMPNAGAMVGGEKTGGGAL
jgi:hypothetical protein